MNKKVEVVDFMTVVSERDYSYTFVYSPLEMHESMIWTIASFLIGRFVLNKRTSTSTIVEVFLFFI